MEELYRQLYSKYSPGLSEDDLNAKVKYASQQDPGVFIDAFYKKYTGSGPNQEQANYISNWMQSDQQETIRQIENDEVENFERTLEDDTWWEKTFGKGSFTNVISDYWRKLKNGDDIGGDGDLIADTLYKDSEKVTDDQIQALIDANNSYKSTDEDIRYQKVFDDNLEKHGRAFAWMEAVRDNPNWIVDQGMQSFGMQIGTAKTTEGQIGMVGGGGVGYTISKYGNKWVDKIPEGKGGKFGTATKIAKKIFKPLFSTYGTARGVMAGNMAALEMTSSMHEAFREELETMGLEANAENYRILMQDKDKMSRLKANAIKRGLTIGAIDYFLAGYTIAGYKGLRSAGLGKVPAVIGATPIDVGSGFVSEVGGQIADERGIRADEILSEGFNIGPGQMINVVSAIRQGRGKYEINGQDVGHSRFREELNNLSDEDIALSDLNVTNDEYVSNVLSERRNDGRIKNSLLNTAVTDVDDRQKLFELEKEKQKLDAEYKKNPTQTLNNEINSKIKQIKDVTSQYFEVDQGLKEKKQAQQNIDLGKTKFEKDVAKGKAILGDKFVYAESQNDFNNIQELKNNFSQEELNQSAGLNFEGKVYINKAIALDQQGNVNVVAHEILHKALGKNMKTSQGKQAAVNFYNSLDKETKRQVDIKMTPYSKEYIAANPDEYIAQYLDLVEDKNSSVDINENNITAINDFLAKFLQSIGLKAKFKTAGDVRRFLTEYRKKFKAGELKLDDTEVGTTFSKVNLPDGNPKEYVDSLTKNAKTKAEFVDNGGFNTVYEGILNGDFDKLMTGMTTAQKELVKFGDPNDPTIPGLALRLANYDPAKTPSLYKWFGSNLVYSKRDANKGLVKQKKRPKSIDAAKKNEEGDTFATQIEDKAELTPEEKTDISLRKAKPKKEKPTLRKKVGFEKGGEVHKKIVDAVKRNILRKIVITRKALKADIATGKYKKGDTITEALDITDLRWQKEISKALGLDLQSLMMERMGRSTLEYTKFLDEFIEEAFEMMDQNLINSRYDDLVVKVVDRQGSQQSALNKKVKSKTAGNALFEKREIAKEELIKYFLKRGRKNSLGQVLGTEFGFDATMEVFADAEFLSKAELALVNKNNLKNKALIAIIAKQINRDPKMKFSKVLSDKQKAELYNSDFKQNLLDQNLPVNQKNIAKVLNDMFPEWGVETVNRFSREVKNIVKKFVDVAVERLGATKELDIGKFIEADFNLRIKKKKLLEQFGANNIFEFFGVKDESNGKILKAQDAYRNEKLNSESREFIKTYHVDKFKKAKDKVKALQLLWLHRRNNTSAGKDKNRAVAYYQVFQGIQDYNENVWGALKEFGVEIIGKDLYYQGKKIKVPVVPSQEANNISKEELTKQYSDRQEYSDLAWEESQNFLAYIMKNGTPAQKAMAVTTMKQDMQGLFKSAAPVEFYFEGKHKGVLTWEHMMSTQQALMRSIAWHAGKSEVSLDQIKAKYKVAVIPKVMDNNINVQFRQDSLADIVNEPIDKRYYNNATYGYKNMFAIKSLDPSKINSDPIGQAWVDAGKENTPTQKDLERLKTADELNAKFSKINQNESKGISIFDFDDTLAISKSKIIVMTPDQMQRRDMLIEYARFRTDTPYYKKEFAKISKDFMKITPAEFAERSADLEAEGMTFDFMEFNKVVEGKKGPFFELAQQINSKFGNKNIYILTARPQQAANAIHTFLKGIGLEIPLKNITGLEDGTAQAKADWVARKLNEGYNNILFADDAIKNVKAVKKLLDKHDVKSDVRQAQVKFSKTLDQNFNEILEKQSGINKDETYSGAAAKAAAQNKNKFKFFIPPSAEDFAGLLYQFLPKGKAGNVSMKFLKQALIDPYWSGIRSLNASKQALASDFADLKKKFPKAFKSLTKDIGYKEFTYEHAIRAYLFNKAGHKVPGLSDKDLKALIDKVESQHNIRGFADLVGRATKLDKGYAAPQEHWITGSIAYDFFNIAQKENRKKHLATWVERKNAIFSEKNMNKIEAIYGTDFKEALEEILWRMENGTNRTQGKSKLVNGFMNWVNNSVGAIMFFNSRSAILQTISMVNFLNWSDNNPMAAGIAFANQPQFWADFSMIFNSDMLKQRRAGLQSDVNEAEIAQAVAGKRDKFSAAVAYLLRKGFLPTQLADSFAISMGGASFYRNRFNTYTSQGLSKEDAKKKAFADFQQTSEESQQSADPALISSQQAGPLGRLILAFQNTPMQYARLIKKAVLDLKNGRGDVKTNISKILYYGAVQNIIFSTLQSGLFFLAFSDEDEEELIESKQMRALNTSLDSLLRGTGVYGAGVSTIKNIILQFNKQNEKGYRADHAYTVIESINLSPPIGSKVRKLYSATQTHKFNKKVIKEMGMDIDNPAVLAIANTISAATNIPLDRVVMKLNNLRAASDSDLEVWKRLAVFLGWNTWDFGIKNKAVEQAKKQSKRNNNRQPKTRTTKKR